MPHATLHLLQVHMSSNDAGITVNNLLVVNGLRDLPVVFTTPANDGARGQWQVRPAK